MKIVFLLILFLITHFSVADLPTHLKCLDNLCDESISTARTVELITSIFGELRQLKKSAKVNIKGKNVDSSDVLWLVEFDGFKGFFNSTMLKENSHSARNDLHIVKNPFYKPPKATIDETEDIEDDKGSKLFFKQEPEKTNSIKRHDETEASDSIGGENKISDELSKSLLNSKEFSEKVLSTTKSDTNQVVIDNGTEEISNNILKESKTMEKNSELKNAYNSEINETIISNIDKVDTIKKDIEINNVFSHDSEHNASVSKDIVIENRTVSDNISVSIEPKNESVVENAKVIAKDIVDDRKIVINPINIKIDKSEVKYGSPVLTLVFAIEKSLDPFIQSFVDKIGLNSWSYFTKFVNNWLNMSVNDFLMLISFFLSLVIIGYTPKMLHLTRDWKYEFEKQSQLIIELESRLRTIEDARQKLTIQNRNFENVMDEYKGKMKDMQEEAANNKRTIMSEFDRMKKVAENKIQNLSRDLEISMKQCRLLEQDIVKKEDVITRLNEMNKKVEHDFNLERTEMMEVEKTLRERLLEIDVLKELLEKVTIEKLGLVGQVDDLSITLSDSNTRFDKLNSCFVHFRMFEDLDEEERREKVKECLEACEVRQRICEVECELAEMRLQLQEAIENKMFFESQNKELQQRTLECEEQRSRAVKEKDTAETTLKVMTEYFHGKEIEIQKTLGYDTEGKSLSVEQSDAHRNRISFLETENDSLTKTIQALKVEVKDLRAFAGKCKNDANTQIANAFMTISNLERELMREKDESKKLRCKLSNYVGPITMPRSGSSSNQKPPFQPSGMADINLSAFGSGNSAPSPPMFNLSILQHTNANKVPFSGRSSANSLSKKSNNS